MEPLQADDPEGFGPYQLLARLGAGGMGRVYLGRSAGGRLVAIKVVHAALAGDPEFRARFRREVTAAGAVSGAFTAPVIDAAPDAPAPWLVTAFLSGLSLQDAVDLHGPFPAPAIAALGASLAEGLAAIHRAGIVHRDLKPSNVLLTPDGPRVIDFGIARAADVSAITQSGMIVGSPGFMPPEQTGNQAGPAGDVFSLGAVLAFAGTGTGPFGTGAMHAMIYRILHEAPRLDGIADPRLRDLLAACLDKDPARRPTVDQVLQWLVARLPEHTAPQSVAWLPPAVTTDITQRTGQIPQGPIRVAPTIPSSAQRGLGRRRAIGIGLATVGAVGAAAAGGAWMLLRDTADYLWTWKNPDGHLLVSPVVTGGLALAVAVGQGGKHTLVALDARTGEQRWKISPNANIASVPGVVDGVGYYYKTTGDLVAFDPKDGKERWWYPITGTGPAPITGGGLIFVQGTDLKTKKPGVQALTTANRQTRWHLPAESSSFPDPVFAEGVLYFGSGRHIGAYDVATGKERWRTQGTTMITGTPVLAGGIVYVSSEAALNALRATDGGRLWSVRNLGVKAVTGGWTPTVIGQTLYLPSADGSLRAHDAKTGRELWSFRAGGEQTSTTAPNPRLLAPAIAGNVACVFNGTDEVSGLDTASGKARWQHRVRAAKTELPGLAGGLFHLATNDGVMSVNPASGKVVQQTDGIRAGVLSATKDTVYFSGAPEGKDLPTTVYAMRTP